MCLTKLLNGYIVCNTDKFYCALICFHFAFTSGTTGKKKVFCVTIVLEAL